MKNATAAEKAESLMKTAARKEELDEHSTSAYPYSDSYFALTSIVLIWSNLLYLHHLRLVRWSGWCMCQVFHLVLVTTRKTVKPLSHQLQNFVTVSQLAGCR